MAENECFYAQPEISIKCNRKPPKKVTAVQHESLLVVGNSTGSFRRRR
jgi:hypothetical protein